MTKTHLTKILRYTEHPLSVQVLHDGLTQIFLSLRGVPHRLCHHGADLCIKVLQRSMWEVKFKHIVQYLNEVGLPCLTLSMALPTLDTLPWMSLCREASSCTVSLMFLQHCAIVWDRTDRSASCTPEKEKKKENVSLCVSTM